MEEIVSEKILIAEPTKGFISKVWADIQPLLQSNESLWKNQSDFDRILAMLSNDQIKLFLDNCDEFFRKKNALTASKLRSKAFELLNKQELDKALLLSNQSVIQAPIYGVDKSIDQGLTLALAYWNRSLVLLHLNYPEKAVRDINLAEEQHISQRISSKDILKRRILCYGLMLDLANREFEKYFEIFFRTSNDDEISELKSEIKQFQNNLSVIKQKNVLEESENWNVIKQENHEVYGRNIVAKLDIKTGDTIIVEKPLVSCLMPQCFGSHCQKCYKKIIAAIPCSTCAGVAFCSIECRSDSLDTFHRYECKILNLLIGSGMSASSYLALRSITDDKFSSSFFDFCSHNHLRGHKDYMQRVLMACFLTRCLQIVKYLPDVRNFTDKVIIENITKLLWALQIVQFNAHEIYETINTGKVHYIAIGLYQQGSKMNHSCYPSTFRYFQNATLVLKALRPYRTGDSIMENYGPNFCTMDVCRRQNSLATRYWFQCKCEACTQNWPTLADLQGQKIITIRCNKCLNGVQVSKNISRNKNLVCPKCQFSINVKETMNMIKTCEDNYTLAKNLLENQSDFEKGIEILTAAIDKFYQVAMVPHYETHVAQQSLRQAYARNGNISYDLIK